MDVLSYADHSRRDKSVIKRYVLVAGGQLAANFGQEIIEQKKWLQSLGVPDKEITCFYSLPSDKEFHKDEAQYRKLAPDLSGCFPAFPGFVYEQLGDGGREDHFRYIYVTGHGSEPFSVQLSRVKGTSAPLQALLAEFPKLDQFTVGLDSLPDGSYSSLETRLALLQKRREPVNRLFFTPRHLRDAIQPNTSAEAKKIIIIQSCHSGGFITADQEKFCKDSLSLLENATILTASRHDKGSFGCNVGGDRTYFGAAFNDEIRTKTEVPPRLNWKEIYRAVAAKVTAMETEYRATLNDRQRPYFSPSEPQFFDTAAR